MRKMGGLKKHMPVTHLTMLDRLHRHRRHPAARRLLLARTRSCGRAFKIGGYGRVVWARRRR